MVNLVIWLCVPYGIERVRYDPHQVPENGSFNRFAAFESALYDIRARRWAICPIQIQIIHTYIINTTHVMRLTQRHTCSSVNRRLHEFFSGDLGSLDVRLDESDHGLRGGTPVCVEVALAAEADPRSLYNLSFMSSKAIIPKRRVHSAREFCSHTVYTFWGISLPTSLALRPDVAITTPESRFLAASLRVVIPPPWWSAYRLPLTPQKQDGVCGFCERFSAFLCGWLPLAGKSLQQERILRPQHIANFLVLHHNYLPNFNKRISCIRHICLEVGFL